MQSHKLPVITPLGTFHPVTDMDAMVYVSGAEKNGALCAAVYSINGYRVCCSLDPAGRNANYINHVSVTRDRRSVDAETALEIAKAICPMVAGWQVDIQRATHLWEEER
jgi:hypothetical protein